MFRDAASSVHMASAIDIDDLAREEVRIRRGKEKDRSDKVFRLLIAFESTRITRLREHLGRKMISHRWREVSPGVTTFTVIP